MTIPSDSPIVSLRVPYLVALVLHSQPLYFVLISPRFPLRLQKSSFPSRPSVTRKSIHFLTSKFVPTKPEIVCVFAEIFSYPGSLFLRFCYFCLPPSSGPSRFRLLQGPSMFSAPDSLSLLGFPETPLFPPRSVSPIFSGLFFPKYFFNRS